MRISQFQKYSQKENTVTNNVLLMLSRLNDLNGNYYKTIIERLNEGNKYQDYNPQPIFSQQINVGNGIIDGHIEVMPSKILIETKLNQKEFIGKLVKYGDVFNSNSQNQLWHLSSQKFDDSEVYNINEKLEELYSCEIQFNNLLFTDLIENLEGIYEEYIHDQELKLLLDDFKNYCYEENLVSDAEYKLLFVPTGFSYKWNLKQKMYFCPKNWHSQRFQYFGLYNGKSVRTISEIETVIIADFDFENQKLDIKTSGHSDVQIERLRKALIEWGDSQKGLKYYLLPESEFYSTDFRKVSHGGIQGYRYKDLRNYIPNSIGNVKEMSERLKNVTWR